MNLKSIAIWLVCFALLFSAGCSRKPSDDSIAYEVKAKFYSDAALKSADLKVDVKNGEVTLSGEAPDAAARESALRAAQAVPGVTRVNDQITVRGAESASAAPPEAPTAAAPAAAPAAPARQARGAAPSGGSRTSAPAGSGATASPAAAAAPAESAVPAKPQVVRVEVPAGTRINLRMIDSIDSSRDQAGQEFRASLDEPIRVDGETAAPKGAPVTIRLAQARSAGRIQGQSELQLELMSMAVGGRTYKLVSDTYSAKGSSRGKETATRVGIGAGVGAAIGAIAGGGKGAAIGAAIGGGGATAVQVLTRGKQVKVPSETQLVFELQQPVTVEKAR